MELCCSISTAKAFITWDSGFKNTDARSDLAVLSSVLLSFVPFVSKCSLPRGGGVKDHEFLTVLLTNPQKKKEKIYPKTTNLLIDKRGHPQVMKNCTVKLGNKERFYNEQIVLRNNFPRPICHLLHKDKELLALRNNFTATKKFLIAKFDCITSYISVMFFFFSFSMHLLSISFNLQRGRLVVINGYDRSDIPIIERTVDHSGTHDFRMIRAD